MTAVTFIVACTRDLMMTLEEKRHLNLSSASPGGDAISPLHIIPITIYYDRRSLFPAVSLAVSHPRTTNSHGSQVPTPGLTGTFVNIRRVEPGTRDNGQGCSRQAPC